MPDPRFFTRTGPFRVREIAAWTGAVCVGDGDLDREIEDLSDLADGGGGDLCYLAGVDFAKDAAESACGACITTPSLADKAPPGAVVLTVEDPQAAFAIAAEAFYPSQSEPLIDVDAQPSGALVCKSAQIAEDVILEAGAIIGPRVKIGARSRVGPGAVVGAGVIVGEDTVIGAQCALSMCLIGNDVVIHPGVKIGQDGFGFVFDNVAGRHRKVPQLGRVVIGNDVEIGANTTIDRGALSDTEIGDGCRIDNQVQIGHNVKLGERCIVVSQVGISGSCTIGDDVVLAGQVGLADHVTIGPRAQVAAKSGVMRDIAPGEAVMGYPAKPIRTFWRETAAIGRLVTIRKNMPDSKS